MKQRMRLWTGAIGLIAGAALDAQGAILNVRVVNPPIDEGSGNANIVIELIREASDVGVCQVSGTVSTSDAFLAQAGVDYAPLTAPFDLTLGINDPIVTQPFAIPILEDGVHEPFEIFDVNLAEDASGCPLPLTVNTPMPIDIADNDPMPASLSFTQSVVAVNEAAGTALVQVTLNGASGIQAPFGVEVLVTGVPGTANDPGDFIGQPQLLSLDDTQLTATAAIPINDDTLSEGLESFTVNLSQGGLVFPDDTRQPVPTGADARVDIVDDDSPGTLQFSAAAFNVAEAAGTLTVMVTRAGGSGGAVTVDVTAGPGSATDGADFTAAGGTLSWADGDVAPKTFNVSVLDDALVDPNETIALALANAGGGAVLGAPATATATIVDDDAPPDAGGDENLSGSPAGPATTTFLVNGTPPFAVSAQLGSVTPASLAAPGNVTYTLTVPATAAIGTTLNDTITVTDGAGNPIVKQVTVQVVAPVARDIASVPTLTPNQQELAGYFDELCPRLVAQGAGTSGEADLVQLCAGLRDPATTDAQVAAAIDAIQPEELIGAAATALKLTGLQHGNLAERINGVRSGASGIDLAGLDLEVHGQQLPGVAVHEMFEQTLGRLLDGLTGGAASADDDFARWGVFANGKASFGEKDETEREAGFEFDSVGVTTGVDYRVRQNLVVGLAVGYAAVESDFDGERGSLDIDSWSGSLYGTYFVADKFYLDAVLSYGESQYDSLRRITYADALGTVDETARGDTDGAQLSGGLATGYDFNRGPWTFGPHVGLYYVDLDVDEVAESGAGGFDLVIGEQEAQSMTLNGGVHVSVVLTPRWGVVVPHARVDFVHEFDEGRELVGIRLANDPFDTDPSDPTPLIELRTDRADPDYFVWSTGASVQFVHGISGFLSYRSTAGLADFSLNEITYGLRFERSF